MRYAADLVVIFEENGAMRYASPSMEQIMGYKPEEVVGELARDLVHPDDVAGMIDTIIDIFWYPDRVDTPLAFRARRKSGGCLHLEGVANNLLGGRGGRGPLPGRNGAGAGRGRGAA